MLMKYMGNIFYFGDLTVYRTSKHFIIYGCTFPQASAKELSDEAFEKAMNSFWEGILPLSAQRQKHGNQSS